MSFFQVGKKYLIRTVTMAQVGECQEVDDTFVVLGDASWVAHTGRFGECLAKGVVHESEPFEHPVAVGIGTIVDATEWPHELPTEAISP